MEEGALYNMTAFWMCAHNGTHIDAPYHFLREGETVDCLPLTKTVGLAYVSEFNGNVTAEDARAMLCQAQRTKDGAEKRILIKGKATVTAEAAEVFAGAGIDLVGNESQTVGPVGAAMEVHLILLRAGVVLLEGIRLEDVPEGVYFLNAAPLSLKGSDGAPCRAILVETEE